MTAPKQSLPEPYHQRYHALTIAASLNLDYKTIENVIAAAVKLEQYLGGAKK